MNVTTNNKCSKRLRTVLKQLEALYGPVAEKIAAMIHVEEKKVKINWKKGVKCRRGDQQTVDALWTALGIDDITHFENYSTEL